MRKSIIYILIIAMSITITNAQRGGAGFFKTGYLYAPGTTDIFREISPSKSIDYSNSYLLLGVEAYYRTQKTIVGCDLYSAIQGNYSLGEHSYAAPFIGASNVKIGRIVRENRQHWLYPSLGLGISGISLSTYDKINGKSTNTVNQILLTPAIDVGINEDFFITKMKANERKYGGMMLGLRAGYRTSFSSTNWRNDNWERLNNMPSYSNNCFYMTVSIGAGGFARK